MRNRISLQLPNQSVFILKKAIWAVDNVLPNVGTVVYIRSAGAQNLSFPVFIEIENMRWDFREILGVRFITARAMDDMIFSLRETRLVLKLEYAVPLIFLRIKLPTHILSIKDLKK